MNPEYPVYIISKGRWDSRLTVKTLERMKVPYHIVVEPAEYDNYAKFINSDKIYTLPFDNLGQGSIPARNWVWEHSINNGFKRHWILDDNIRVFRRFNNNKKYEVMSGTIFKCAEDFVDRYENIALAGFQYSYFVTLSRDLPPFFINTRIYSCILVKNDIPYRWRGIYNEDSDLSIRVLKDGWVTILFIAFLQDKVKTMMLGGGNTDAIYNKGDNRLEFAQSLQEQHPDCVKVVWRYNRWHHEINFNKFKENKLIKKEGLIIPDTINDYGMKLVDKKTINIDP
jgi:TET-Associated Glycosyltransferase